MASNKFFNRRFGRIAIATAGVGLGIGLLLPATASFAAEPTDTASTTAVSTATVNTTAVNATTATTANTATTVSTASSSTSTELCAGLNICNRTDNTITVGSQTIDPGATVNVGSTGQYTLTYSDGSTARISVDDGGADTFWEIRVGGDVTSDEWGEEPGSGQSHTESLKSGGASYEAIYQGNGVMVLNVNGK